MSGSDLPFVEGQRRGVKAPLCQRPPGIAKAEAEQEQGGERPLAPWAWCSKRPAAGGIPSLWCMMGNNSKDKTPAFSDKENLQEFTSAAPVQQHMLKEFLQEEGK